MNKKEELQIIAKIKSGDQNASRKLFDFHADNLFCFLMQFAKDRDLAEDWTQNTFIKAFRYINGFHGTSKFSTWLFRIGLNEMRSDLKKNNKWNFEDLDAQEKLHKVEFEDNFEWTHDMKWLLSGLTEEKKAIFILFEVEGYSHSEIAEMMDTSVVACRTSLSRTKKYLREKWLKQSETI
ncbi:MAG: RNA polymerase sigma factor [Melioribacteraceae bacterium]|nr:RNA polymerase sigma factor [Melioribacteraceae bacterium]